MNQAIGLVTLVVRDYDDAIRFYVEKLGFSVWEDREIPAQRKRWVVIGPPGAAGCRLVLAQAATPEQSRAVGTQAAGRVFLFLQTDDFWGDYARYVSRGVEFVRPPVVESFGTVAVFRDLYGTLWDLIGAPESAPSAHAKSFDQIET